MPLDLDHLNPAQREAVNHQQGPLLVLAGAGSGKTRVITYRIARLIEDGIFPSHNILAVTFTNKAAAEMRERVSKVLGTQNSGVTVGTFHAVCARLLRRYAEEIGRTKAFDIYDSKDSEDIVKTVLNREGISTDNFPPRKLVYAISGAKTELQNPDEMASKAMYLFDKTAAHVYGQYEKLLAQSNALDFGDLIYRTVKLLQSNEGVLAEVRSKYQYLLVDEYQDTNKAQFEIVKLLAGEEGNVTVVGDDDQSIYAFRGADPSIILNFEKSFKAATVVKLEQNYRSTQTIVEASNAVAAKNEGRKAKRLFTEEPAGQPVGWLLARDERSEASYVARRIKELVENDPKRTYADAAVFYRTNFQSRSLEEQFNNESVPYVIIGGTGFYQRKEVKDALAYLRVITDPVNSISLQRIINTPRRGIGKTSIDAIIAHAYENDVPLWESIKTLIQEKGLATAALRSVKTFVRLITEMQEKAKALAIPDLINTVLTDTGYYEMLDKEAEKSSEAQERKSNLIELINAAAQYVEEHQDESGLEGFLELTALSTSEDTTPDDRGQVKLMTLHGAKGLEFPFVFVTGMEDGLLPHMNSKESDEALEEERRLFYVGMTRARELLTLTAAGSRRHMGIEQYKVVSQFVGEVPKEYLKEVTAQGFQQSSPAKTSQRGNWGRSAITSPTQARRRVEDMNRRVEPTDPAKAAKARAYTEGNFAPLYAKGDRVHHKRFGEGVVVSYDGVQRVQVKFTKTKETKTLDTGFAKLEKLN